MAGVGNAFQNSCILTALGVFVIMVNSMVMSRIGRRRVFLMIGMVLCGVSQLITAVVYTVNPGTQSTGKAVVGLAVIFIMGYNVSFGKTSFNSIFHERISPYIQRQYKELIPCSSFFRVY